MNKTFQDRVHSIAQDVRLWAEGRAQSDENSYASLVGYCAIASAKLFSELQKKGFDPEIHIWVHGLLPDAHVFIILEDHVVDITATQFRDFEQETVVIMHVKEAEAFKHWHSILSFDSVKELIAYQKKTRWPRDQIAYSA